jgi:hypothetical protein
MVASNDSDAKEFLKMVLATRKPDDWDDRDEAIRGACLFRDGQYQEASRVLGDLSKKLATGGDMADPLLIRTRYLQSMARHALGEKLPARRILAEANRGNVPAVWAIDNTNDWQRRVILSALREEAEATIGM